MTCVGTCGSLCALSVSSQLWRPLSLTSISPNFCSTMSETQPSDSTNDSPRPVSPDEHSSAYRGDEPEDVSTILSPQLQDPAAPGARYGPIQGRSANAYPRPRPERRKTTYPQPFSALPLPVSASIHTATPEGKPYIIHMCFNNLYVAGQITLINI